MMKTCESEAVKNLKEWINSDLDNDREYQVRKEKQSYWLGYIKALDDADLLSRYESAILYEFLSGKTPLPTCQYIEHYEEKIFENPGKPERIFEG